MSPYVGRWGAHYDTSTVDDDILCQFESQNTAKRVWDALQAIFVVNTTTQWPTLNIKFDYYKISPWVASEVFDLYDNITKGGLSFTDRIAADLGHNPCFA